MSLRLIIEDDEGTTTIVPLGKDAITIGRQQGNTIQLIEKNVSRRHARLFLDDAELWILEDLGSYNGIKVNGVAIEAQVKLKEGDVVQIGDYHLALTEDVDKRTLNFSGAANDPGAPQGAEALLASSSNELQSLSADELAMIQSGPHGVVAPPMMLDSGAIPAAAPGAYEERRKGGAGFLVGFGAVVVVALIIGGVWFASSGKDTAPADKEQIAARSVEPAKSAAVEPVVLPPVEPPAAGVVNPANPVLQPPEPEELPDPELDDPEESGAVPDEPEVVDEPEVIPEEPPAAAVPDTPKPPKKTPRRNTGNSSPPPSSTPAKPAVDADALAAEAAAAAFSNPKKCFDLAKQSYNAKRNATVAQRALMCACNIPDASKAKWAVGKVPPSKRDTAAKVCEKKGITL